MSKVYLEINRDSVICADTLQSDSIDWVAEISGDTLWYRTPNDGVVHVNEILFVCMIVIIVIGIFT